MPVNLPISGFRLNESHLIAALIAAKLFPSYSLNSALLKMLSRQEFHFTEDNNFGERMTKSGECISCTVDDEFPSSMTIGCVRLLIDIRSATSDSNLKVVIDKLEEYIDSTGDRIKPQEFWEE